MVAVKVFIDAYPATDMVSFIIDLSVDDDVSSTALELMKFGVWCHVRFLPVPYRERDKSLFASVSNLDSMVKSLSGL